ncbi:MAG TPA: cation-efflux pump [Terriglobales bacterium]|nr:cation-efflux pump [Terriglobales bacterium]
MPDTATLSGSAIRTEKRSVAQNSVWAAVAVTLLKIVVGISTGSLGILSEALHSGLDLVAAVITLLSVRVSDKPADAEHQYGHGKIESFSAFLETGLLLLTCAWIIWEAIQRLFFRTVEIEPSLAAFAVMGFSIGVDWWRSRALQRIADKYDSQALQADALHFRTDIWSSAVVILGLVLVWAGEHYQIRWLERADPIAALFVAGVVISVSWRLARQTTDALLDAAPKGARARVIEAVSGVPGVLEVDRARIRRAGNRFFADLSVGLSRNVTFQKSEQVVGEVTSAVRGILPDADVVVHSLPREVRGENIFDRIRAVAARHNLGVHDISIQDLHGRLHVEQHLEMQETLPLKQAHDRVTQLENEMREQIGEISTILTHIESEPATIETGDELVQNAALERRLKEIALQFSEVKDVHEMRFKRVGGKLYVSCHCTMGDELPLSRVHEVMTALEIRFKQQAPELFRVLIHPEPQTDNTR